mmetsp:Transcript_113556/g.331816  ORF Transcript_113556/g.331816 Transcript_113556/m.331816 type:complete len:129 (-) Transcript_113556:42-428(-)
MGTKAAAWQLIEEFRPWVQWYNFGAAFVGVALGAWDGPACQQPLPESTATPSKAQHPSELGFLRQLAVTSPGVALALRLGRRAREIGAPPSALAVAALPCISCPLILYISGYPTGVALRAWTQQRHAE